MKYAQLTPASRPASVIAMGSTYFGTDLPRYDSFAILDAFYDIGGTFIDTARVYGDWAPGVPSGMSETTIGEWMRLRGNRDRLFIATKGGHPPLDDMRGDRLSRAEIEHDIDLSLKALGIDEIDLYWLHRDAPARAVEDIMESLWAIMRAGKARAVGVSNWSAARMKEANAYADAKGGPRLCADQPQWALARMQIVEDETLTQMDAELYAFHKTAGMAVIPYSSQAKGFFIKLQAGEGALSEKARRRFLNEMNLRIFEALKGICARTGWTIGDVQLAFLLRQPFPVFPIVGASKVEQVMQLAKVAETELSDQDFAALMGMTGLE